MRELSTDNTKLPLLRIDKNNSVVDASSGFVNLSGYSLTELLGKSLNDISRMIRIDSQIMLEEIQDELTAYIFNKSLELMEVVISCRNLGDTNEKGLYFGQLSTVSIEEHFHFSQQLYTNRKTGIIVLGFPDLLILKVSQTYLDNLEAPYSNSQNVIGKTYRQIVPNHMYDMMHECREHIQNTGEPYYVEEEPVFHPTVGIRYWNGSTVPVSEKGEIKYLIHSILDVTNKVLDQQDLEQKNKELEAIIENISEEVLIVNKDGELTRVNMAARSNRLYDLISFSKAEVFSRQFEIFTLNKEIIPFEERPTQKIMRQERFSAYRIIMKNSKGIQYKEVSGTPIYDSNNDFMGGVLMYRDIAATLIKEENILLKTQYDLLNRMIENLELGLVRFSYPDFKIIDMNNHFSHNFIVDKIGVELRLSPLRDRVNFKQKLQWVVDEKNGVHSEIIQFSISGEQKYFKFIYQPLFKLNRKVKEIIVMAVEVTEEVSEKNKLEQILKMQEEVFVNISHECRTPLNIIFSTCQLMELYLMGDINEETKNKLSKNIQSIKQNCNRFIKIINNIIDLSQIKSGGHHLNLTNEDIVSKVEDIVESVLLYAKEKDFNIVFNTNVKEKYIAVDMVKIERAILNLISNAIKFSGKSREIYIDIINQGDIVEICVADKGIGIDRKYLESIFNPFNQVDKSLMRVAEGSGIGLSLVKAIVEMHSGKISVESKIGKGSKFKIELPVLTIKEPDALNGYRDFDGHDNRLSVELSDIY